MNYLCFVTRLIFLIVQMRDMLTNANEITYVFYTGNT